MTAICKNHIVDGCIECRGNQKPSGEHGCMEVYSFAFHCHCTSPWLKTQQVCLLDKRGKISNVWTLRKENSCIKNTWFFYTFNDLPSSYLITNQLELCLVSTVFFSYLFLQPCCVLCQSPDGFWKMLFFLCTNPGGSRERLLVRGTSQKRNMVTAIPAPSSLQISQLMSGLG